MEVDYFYSLSLEVVNDFVNESLPDQDQRDRCPHKYYWPQLSKALGGAQLYVITSRMTVITISMILRSCL